MSRTESKQIASALAAVQARLPSPHSRSSYASNWGRFQEWARSRRLALLEAKPRDIEAYLETLRGAGKSPATIGLALSVITQVFGALVRDEAMAANPAREVKRPSGDHAPKTPWQQEGEIQRLFEVPARSWAERRDRLVLTLLFGLGWRRAEIAALRVEDFVGATVTGLIKRRKKITVGVPPQVLDAVADWRRRAGIDSGPLLPRGESDPRAISGDMVYGIVRRAAARAGLDASTHVTPHSLRRSKITIEGKRGVPLKQRQLAVGHSSQATTERYDKAREAAENAPGAVLADLMGGKR